MDRRPARDSLFGERIIWRGNPRVCRIPAHHKVAAGCLFVLAATSLCFAAVTAFALDRSPGALVIFSFFTAGLGLVVLEFQKFWLARVEYRITDDHVIVKRGPFRRAIQRSGITFARIVWDKDLPGVGDIELVRAVPTGVLRRRLALRMPGIAAPDKVWDMICGERDAVAANHRGDRALGQRLEPGERVIWSEPALPLRNPPLSRDLNVLLLGLTVLTLGAYMVVNYVPILRRLINAGLGEIPGALPALIIAQTLVVVPILGFGLYLLYHSVLLPRRLMRNTYYLITDRRVLIQRANEELHLNRRSIVDAIESEEARGIRDVFLVLDGPRARALETSGAFGKTERGTQLRPVIEGVYDAEHVTRILKTVPPPANDEIDKPAA